MKKYFLSLFIGMIVIPSAFAGPIERRYQSPVGNAGLSLDRNNTPDADDKLSDDPQETAPSNSQPLPKTESKNEWLIAPLPFHQPTIGWGVQGALSYLYHPFKDDPDGRPWMTGAAGLYSSNGSWMGVLFHKMSLDHDRWRASLAGVTGRFNYDYFGIGTAAGEAGVSIPLNQDMNLFTGTLLRQIVPNWYAGAGYAFMRVNVKVDTSVLPPTIVLPSSELDSNLANLTFHLQHDSRDNEYFPSRGGYSKLAISESDDAWGSDYNYTNIKLESNRYIEVADRQILALRAAARWVDSGAPFFATPSFGSSNDLRGYLGGQYRDRTLWAVQGEYRYPIWRALGGVFFSGVGEVAHSVAAVNVNDLLPSGGLGLRYTIAAKNHVNIRFDYAWGKASNAFYFGVGEAF